MHRVLTSLATVGVVALSYMSIGWLVALMFGVHQAEVAAPRLRKPGSGLRALARTALFYFLTIFGAIAVGYTLMFVFMAMFVSITPGTKF